MEGQPAANGLIVVVTGDVTMDWNLARVQKPHRRGEESPGRTGTTEDAAEKARTVDRMWTRTGTTHAAHEGGGALLLARLITEVAADVAKVDVRAAAEPSKPVSSNDDRFHHSFAIWSEVEEREPPPWRIETFLGIDPAEDSAAVAWSTVQNDPDDADIVVLDDGGLGFREHDEVWPQVVKRIESWPGAGSPERRAPWVVLKSSRPVAEGRLWTHLLKRADRLIVVMRIDDLRLTEVQISRELSWERSAQDLMWELINNPRVNALAACAHVVVSFGTAGALLLSAPAGGDGAPAGTLFFDPRVMEDMWNEKHRGRMMGYMSCLTASIARQVMLSYDAPKLDVAIQRGVEAMRTLHLEGYEEAPATGARPRLRFPMTRVVEVLVGEKAPLSVHGVRDPTASVAPSPGETEPELWTILEERFDNLEDVARDVVLLGSAAVLTDVPVGEFGDLVTVDRQEIEGFRSIRTLIREYEALTRDPKTRPKWPLSIAVFGPPGSGKSFGVKQVAKSALPGRIQELTFNLSQFDDPAPIVDAMHQVRDWSLKGMLPLVFWDEFDTTLGKERLGWLRHFLSPMQDGTFQHGQVTHPIGPAVFVFAGGTEKRMQDFASRKSREYRETGDPELLRTLKKEFRDVKGPDFVSRLKGYVNIVGPNPREGGPVTDPHYLIRRAIVLRQMLQANAGHLFQEHDGKRKVKKLQIDPGVLRAFLHTRLYRHGARSMESIIAMSLLAGRTRFERSCLPAEEQLDLHVNACDFLSRVLQPELTGSVIERLAEGAHIVYCAEKLEQEFSWAEDTDEYLERQPLLQKFVGRARDPKKVWKQLVAYERLGEQYTEENRALVRFMSKNLEGVGYLVWPARTRVPPIAFTADEVEVMSEHEHERWMWSKLSGGWRYGEEKDEENRTQPLLVPWRKISDEERRRRYRQYWEIVGPGELSEEERELDRALIRKYPTFLQAAGYTALKCEERTELDEGDTRRVGTATRREEIL